MRGFVVVALAALVFAPGSRAADTTLIAAGAYHGCAGTSTSLSCWGSNSAGELGDGTTKDSVVPVRVEGLPTPILEVGASYDRTCALVAGPRVYCWGRSAKLDSTGRLVGSLAPVKVSGIPSTAHGLAVGVKHACVLDPAGASWCWGLNDRGEVGDGTTKPRPKPVKAKAATAARLVASDGYTCALLAAGGVSCWGRSHGTAGDPLNPEGLVVGSTKPRPIAGLEQATDLAATGDFACALLAGGAVSCWGENDHGQLGDGTVTGRSTPALVALPATSQVIATANHACVIAAADGSVLCWGRGDHGQIGNGAFEERHTPDLVATPEPAARLFGGSSGHWTLAVGMDGSAFAWGRDQYGQLGDRSTNDVALPVPILLP